MTTPNTPGPWEVAIVYPPAVRAAMSRMESRSGLVRPQPFYLRRRSGNPYVRDDYVSLLDERMELVRFADEEHAQLEADLLNWANRPWRERLADRETRRELVRRRNLYRRRTRR